MSFLESHSKGRNQRTKAMDVQMFTALLALVVKPRKCPSVEIKEYYYGTLPLCKVLQLLKSITLKMGRGGRMIGKMLRRKA